MGTRLKNWFTLDNGSTLSLSSKPDLVENIWTTSKNLLLATRNAEVKHSNQEAVVPGFGKVYFGKQDAIANIFGFSDLEKRCWITYDPFKGNCFYRS